MEQQLVHISFVVKDYGEAIDFFVNKLGFKMVEDTKLSETKRWVIVAPAGSGSGCNLLLAKAASESQEKAVGMQAGGRVAFFLETDDIIRDYESYTQVGVHFRSIISEASYGFVAVFEDLYGNPWDLIQRKTRVNH